MANVQELLGDKGRFVATIDGEKTVLEAAQLMNERKIGALVVVEGERVAGIFTERDILVRVVAAERDPAGTTVGEVMTSPVASCRPDTTVEECVGVMTSKRIRHLPVVDAGRLVGIVTSGDILAHEVSQHQATIEYLQGYLWGGTPQA